MPWETAGVIAEIVAAIAVLVSLWYLAIQLKQNTELERAQLEVQLGLTWADLHDNMIQNPNLARAYDLAAESWNEMSDEDVRAYLWFVAKSFHFLLCSNHSSEVSTTLGQVQGLDSTVHSTG